MTFPWEGPPDFVNPEGTKWWREMSLTRYAQKEDRHGTVLDVVCFLIETADKYRTYVMVSRDQAIIEEDQSLEAMGIKIDVRKLLKRDPN